MDVLFDRNAALQLIRQINACCNGMVEDTQELIRLMDQTDTWNDYQKRAFKNNLKEIAEDLNKALKYEDDYMKTYYQRVQELGG